MIDRALARGTAAGCALRVMRAFVAVVIDSMCWLVPRGGGECALVVRLDAIGDFFIWMQSGAVDVARYARGLGATTVLLANSSWADYARATGLWHEVIPVKPERFMRNALYRVRKLCRIRRMGVSTLIQARSARVFLLEDAIARVSGARRRIGNAGTLLNMSARVRRLGNHFYDELIEVSQGGTIHETARNGEFVLGLTGGKASRFDFPVMLEHNVADTIVIVPGAGDGGRVWPIEKLAAVVRHIRRRYPSLRVVLVGAPADMPAAQRLVTLVGDLEFENEVGLTSLDTYIQAIAASKLVICNDSSAYHIAMAYDKDVVCFLGGGQYGWFAPYPRHPVSRGRGLTLSVAMECFGCNWGCRYPRAAQGAFRCVESISVEDAIASVEALLAKQRI